MPKKNPVVVIDTDTTDAFLQSPEMKYEGGTTLEVRAWELGIKAKPMKLPRPASLDDD